MAINHEFRLKRIIRTIKEGKANEISAEMILKDLEQIFPPKIIEVEIKPKSSPEQLEYLRNYRRIKKEDAKIVNEKQKEQNKINNALKRNKIYCYFCNKIIDIENPSSNECEIIKKKNRAKRSIIVFNYCPEGHKIKSFGGFID